ncbi:MAG: choice-of-anchor E domain-containing protein [Bryobacterales bacterium]|nr:choice-of-anchor E domain-containing protein [Bryobacterales bacterium]
MKHMLPSFYLRVGLVGLLLVGGQAASYAAVISVVGYASGGSGGSNEPLSYPPDYNYSGLLPQFNPDTGTLQAVGLRYGSFLAADWSFGNPDVTPRYFSVSASSLTYLASGVGISGPSLFISGFSEIPALDSVQASASDNLEIYTWVTRESASNFDAFIGHDAILIQGFASFSHFASDADFTGSWSFRSHSYLEVEYFYEVPEPGTFAPVMLGAGLIGWRARRRISLIGCAPDSRPGA